jgi:glutamyl-tRNA reductase
MPFLALGFEHKTAPLVIRERVALGADDIEHLSRRLIAEPAIAEIAFLSTCNRTEVYFFAEEESLAIDVLTRALSWTASSLATYLRTWRELEVAEHLFRVAAGLESQILGEIQILSQVRDTFETGQRLGSVGVNLHSLFRTALSCAKQARAGAALGRVDASVGSQAVSAAEESLGGLDGRSVLLIGGGEVARLVAERLGGMRLEALFIANRTPTAAIELAARHNATPATLTDIPRLLPQVDVVISATSARGYMLSVDDVEPLGERAFPLEIFDLAIPRDIEPSVGSVPGVRVRDLDDLLSGGQMEQWQADIRQIEGIIAAEVHEFMVWYQTRRVVPVITHLRQHVEEVARIELQRVAPQLKDLTQREQAAVESLTQRLIDKMFHHLVIRLRLAAQTDPKLVDAAKFLFLHGEGGLFPDAMESELSSFPPEPAQGVPGSEQDDFGRDEANRTRAESEPWTVALERVEPHSCNPAPHTDLRSEGS